MILQLENLEAAYGMSQVLFGVNLDVREKQVTCLLGRNGVGKSTTIKTIMGVLKPRAGNIRYKGTEIGGMVPNKINRLGVAYVPQGRQVFPTLTVRENIIFGERKPKEKRTKVWTLDEIYELFPRLKERQNFMGDRISGGEQQMMVIARALMQNPDLLLLDEICEGLAHRCAGAGGSHSGIMQTGSVRAACGTERKICVGGKLHLLHYGKGCGGAQRRDKKYQRRSV